MPAPSSSRNPSSKPRPRRPRPDDNGGRHSRHFSTDALLTSEERERGYAQDQDQERERERDRGDVRDERHREPRDERRGEKRRSYVPTTQSSVDTTSNGVSLSMDALARLDALNERSGGYVAAEEEERVRTRDRERDREDRIREKKSRERERERKDRKDRVRDRGPEDDEERERRRRERRRRRREDGERELHGAGDADHNHYREKTKYREKRRIVSGPLLEEGGNYNEKPRLRGGANRSESDDRTRRRKKKKKWIIGIIVAIIILIIIIAAAVAASKHNSSSSDDLDSSDNNPKPANTNLNGISQSSIPASARGTYLDPFTWYDTLDFNVTYTDATVGGLPIMGLNSTWNNNVRANPSVPPLTEAWTYGTQKVHGINLGGWLSIEPFITPSLFNSFSESDGVVDEWTLSQKLGPTQAAQTIEEHYSSFVSYQTFVDIAAAGFDHVRIPYSYWAVTTYSGDPYVPKISWRYLLRAIEWARENGLRINLDLHGAPGSQNGWNHSGHQGPIGWLNGTDGALNAQRTIDIHQQLAAFFSQPRYKNLISMYGLVNEPRMVDLPASSVVTWSQNAITAIRNAGLSDEVIIVIGDGFRGLANWADSPLYSSSTLLDAHQYVIFNSEQIILSHSDKINFACNGWTQQSQQSMNTATGFGSFLCGEWSQADTDCQTYLNDVNVGSRWEGTLNLPNTTLDVLTPTCPLSPSGKGSECECANAMADASSYSAVYKQWLLMFAEAQMHSFEVGWGWFYWTWKTESATQWDYQAGMAAGILPTNVRDRSFDCSQSIPDFDSLGLSEAY